MTLNARDGRFEERFRLPVEAESHVHRPQRIQKGGLDLRLFRELRFDTRRALVQHLARGQAVAARLAGVGDLEQVDEKRGCLPRGLCFTLGNDSLALRRGASN